MSKLTTHQRKARDLMQREDWDGALAELQRVLSLDANNPMLHNQIGDVHLRKGDVDQACDHFELAVDLYSNLGLHNNAVALCRKVVRLAPTRVEVRYNLARLRMDQGLRSDAANAFVDYLDHAHPDDDDAADALEQRCVDVVDSFPDIAPVGQILEKLEALKRPDGAYKIVQRAAQRAADTGDVPAAKRLTEKMRSLRVLLKSQGREADVALEEPVEPEQAESESTARAELEDAVASGEVSGAASVSPSVEPVRRVTDPGAIDLPAIDRKATESTVSEDEAAIPEIDLDDVEPLDSTLADWDAESEAQAAVSVDEVAASAAPSIEAPPQTASDQTPSAQTPDDGDVLVGDVDPDLMPEYELPETSLEDVANLLQQEGVEPTPLDEAAAADATLLEEEAEAVLQEDAVDEAQHAATIAETFADPPASARRAPDTDVDSGSVDEDRPASVVYEPTPGARRPSGASDDVRRQPVWIPSPDAMSPDPTPSEEGQTQELEEVIDTFREQMARALGDDGAARYDLGVAYYDMGLYNEALAEFEVAVRCPGLANRTLEMMASCLAQQGRHDEVVSLLAGPLAENDTPSTERLALQYAMGLALEAVGQVDDARRHFEEVALVDIGFKDVQSRLQR